MRKWLSLLAGAAACGVGFLGYLYLTLPDVERLATANPATTAFIELRADEARARGDEPKLVQQWVPYRRISGALKRAVLVTEDSEFWQHDGIDLENMKESLQQDLKKRTFVRGGSTITQQLAKNLYLTPSKNPVRKLRELLIARRLEGALSKTRILELYLNVIEWGDRVYGAEAAARTYFKKPASALNADEAALLAACIINPRIMNPARRTPGLARRQRMILGRMGVVTPPPDVATAAPEPAQPAAAPETTPAAPEAAPAAPEATPAVEPATTEKPIK